MYRPHQAELLSFQSTAADIPNTRYWEEEEVVGLMAGGDMIKQRTKLAS